MSATPGDWARNLSRVRERIAAACDRVGRDPAEVQLLPITKSLPRTSLSLLSPMAMTEIGENRVLEGLSRRRETNATFRWHMVGHVQTNKVKKLLEWADVLHSLDREALVPVLEMELSRRDRILPCYLQVNVSGESSKGGIPPGACGETITRIREEAPHVDLFGLMTMAPAGEDARGHFRRLRELALAFGMKGLSMGMSQDFETAVEEGATCVRVGGSIFR
jgi:pyridoxal phosphate enzyme (YggS family)